MVNKVNLKIEKYLKQMIKHTNTYIPEKIKKENAVYDIIFGAGDLKRTESFNWKEYLPEREIQWWIPFCVSFSRLECAEAVAFKIGIDINFSDRRLGVESGTTKVGNSMDKVSDTFKNKGVDQEEFTPFTKEMFSEGWNAWDDIFNLPEAGERYYGGNHSWIWTKSAMIDALDYSPLSIAVGENNENWENTTVVQNPTRVDFYHCVTLYYIDDEGRYYVRDSLGKEFKILNKDYSIKWCKSFRDLPKNWKKNMENEFVKIIKQKDSKAVGFWIPATSEDALKTLALSFGKTIEKREDGEVDWDATIEGELELK